MKMQNPSSLLIFACNRSGLRRKEGGDKVSCRISSPQDFDPLQVEDLNDGRYRVQFMPRAAGNYTLHVSVGPEGSAEAISGSPFMLSVRAPTNYRMLGGMPGAEECEGKKRFGEADQAVHHPAGIDFDHTGRYLFVSDQSSHRIQAFDAHQGHEPVCSFGKRGFGVQDMDTPHAVVADRDNRIVVSDVLNHRLQVLEFIPKSKIFRHVCSIGGPGSGEGEFQFPKGLAITENSQLLVCDFGNHRVQVFDMSAGFRYLREFGSMGSEDGQFNSPLDVAVNCGGELLVSDMNHRIQVFDEQGKFLRAFGSKGRKDGEFNYPISLVTNDENALFVCDQGNHRMQVFDAATGGFIHKWGGSKKKKAEGEIDEEEAKTPGPEWIGMRSPAGVAVNADGSVVVTDYKLNAIFAF
jgi:DNA-binding beta-propeller fold protein YncE